MPEDLAVDIERDTEILHSDIVIEIDIAMAYIVVDTTRYHDVGLVIHSSRKRPKACGAVYFLYADSVINRVCYLNFQTTTDKKVSK